MRWLTIDSPGGEKAQKHTYILAQDRLMLPGSHRTKTLLSSSQLHTVYRYAQLNSVLRLFQSRQLFNKPLTGQTKICQKYPVL